MNPRVSIKVNGTPQPHEVAPRLPPVHFLRDNCKFTIVTAAARA